MNAIELNNMYTEWLDRNELPADLDMDEAIEQDGLSNSQKGWLECFREAYYHVCEFKS